MYNPWFALGVTLIVLCSISTSLFDSADAPPTDGPHRVQTLDGLRGLAAFGVFLHHSVILHDYLARGVWQLPPSRFFSMVGQVGVSVFFLITGYLFWSKLLRERGRPNWTALYIGRVFRIGPVYSLALVAIGAAVVVTSHGTLAEDGWHVTEECAKWLSLGMFSAVPINGDGNTGLYLAGVTWSLQYEWAFYAALIALSLGARRERFVLPFAIVLCLACVGWRLRGAPTWLSETDPIDALLFTGGMICASLEARAPALTAPPWLLSVGCLAATLTTFLLFPVAYALLPTLLLGLAFACVIAGGDLFGLLRSRGARRLGDISFGVYLLQGPVLMLVFQPQIIRTHALASKSFYWAVVLAAAIALVALATAAHTWLERPGIRAGRKLTDLLFARHRRPLSAASLQADTRAS